MFDLNGTGRASFREIVNTFSTLAALPEEREAEAAAAAQRKAKRELDLIERERREEEASMTTRRPWHAAPPLPMSMAAAESRLLFLQRHVFSHAHCFPFHGEAELLPTSMLTVETRLGFLQRQVLLHASSRPSPSELRELRGEETEARLGVLQGRIVHPKGHIKQEAHTIEACMRPGEDSLALWDLSQLQHAVLLRVRYRIRDAAAHGDTDMDGIVDAGEWKVRSDANRAQIAKARAEREAKEKASTRKKREDRRAAAAEGGHEGRAAAAEGGHEGRAAAAEGGHEADGSFRATAPVVRYRYRPPQNPEESLCVALFKLHCSPRGGGFQSRFESLSTGTKMSKGTRNRRECPYQGGLIKLPQLHRLLESFQLAVPHPHRLLQRVFAGAACVGEGFGGVSYHDMIATVKGRLRELRMGELGEEEGADEHMNPTGVTKQNYNRVGDNPAMAATVPVCRKVEDPVQQADSIAWDHRVLHQLWQLNNLDAPTVKLDQTLVRLGATIRQGAQPRGWEGVRFNPQGRVEEIDLSGKGLSILPASLGALRHLRVLYLGRNLLRNVPEALWGLPLLARLHLEHNQLESLTHQGEGGVPVLPPALRVLRMQGNPALQFQASPQLAPWLLLLQERGCCVVAD